MQLTHEQQVAFQRLIYQGTKKVVGTRSLMYTFPTACNVTTVQPLNSTNLTAWVSLLWSLPAWLLGGGLPLSWEASEGYFLKQRPSNNGRCLGSDWYYTKPFIMATLICALVVLNLCSNDHAIQYYSEPCHWTLPKLLFYIILKPLLIIPVTVYLSAI